MNGKFWKGSQVNFCQNCHLFISNESLVLENNSTSVDFPSIFRVNCQYVYVALIEGIGQLNHIQETNENLFFEVQMNLEVLLMAAYEK